MSDHGHECPFLNQSDPRCEAHFCLDRLQHALEHCLYSYRTCPLYAVLLMERSFGRDVSYGTCEDETRHAVSPPVQVTVTRRNHGPLAGAA